MKLELDSPSFTSPSPANDVDVEHIPSLILDNVCHIIALLDNDYDYDDFAAIDASELCVTINAIISTATTPKEQALGTFTRRKLKKLPNWSQ